MKKMKSPANIKTNLKEVLEMHDSSVKILSWRGLGEGGGKDLRSQEKLCKTAVTYMYSTLSEFDYEGGADYGVTSATEKLENKKKIKETRTLEEYFCEILDKLFKIYGKF